MLESLKPKSGKRWPRGQKFSLTSRGAEAEVAYRETVRLARAQGREALDSGQRAWAAPLGVEPADGVLLGELRGGRRGLSELARGLEECGTTPAEVKAAVDRLTDAGLVEPAPGATVSAA